MDLLVLLCCLVAGAAASSEGYGTDYRSEYERGYSYRRRDPYVRPYSDPYSRPSYGLVYSSIDDPYSTYSPHSPYENDYAYRFGRRGYSNPRYDFRRGGYYGDDYNPGYYSYGLPNLNDGQLRGFEAAEARARGNTEYLRRKALVH